MRELVTFFDFLLTASVVLGTGLGFVFSVVLGPAKMVEKGNWYDMNRANTHGFRYVYGPLLGLNGRLLLLFLGSGEISAGACVFIGVWLDVVAVLGSVPAFLTNLMRGMVIVAAMGLLAEMGVATALQQRLSEIADDESDSDDDQPDAAVKVAIGTKERDIPKMFIPFFYAIQLTLFVLIRIIGFYPQGPFTQTLTGLMSLSLLLLAGFMVLHAHENGRHRKELGRGLDSLNDLQVDTGGMIL